MRLCLLMAIVLLALLCGIGLSWQDRQSGLSLLLGGLTLGGAWLICLVFSLRDYWHGIIGAATVAFLSITRAPAQLRALGEWLSGPPPRPAPLALIEIAITVIAFMLFMIGAKAVLDERRRRVHASFMAEIQSGHHDDQSP